MSQFTSEVRRRLELALDEMQETGCPPREVLRHAADVNLALEEIDRLRAALGVNEG